jgi:hypothetical protein
MFHRHRTNCARYHLTFQLDSRTGVATVNRAVENLHCWSVERGVALGCQSGIPANGILDADLSSPATLAEAGLKGDLPAGRKILR